MLLDDVNDITTAQSHNIRCLGAPRYVANSDTSMTSWSLDTLTVTCLGTGFLQYEIVLCL